MEALVAARRSPGPEAREAHSGQEAVWAAGLLVQPGRETTRNGGLTAQTDRATAWVVDLTAQPGHETSQAFGLKALIDRGPAWAAGLTPQPGREPPRLVDLTALSGGQSAQSHDALLRRGSAQAPAC